MSDARQVILIAVPSPGFWRAPTAVAVAQMAADTAAVGVNVRIAGGEGAYTEVNRNNLVETALRMGAAGIMWVDSDMRFPSDALLRLMGHDKDIVGAMYRERDMPFRFHGCFLDGDDNRAWDTGLQPAALLPGGMILVKRGVYEQLPRPWYKLDEEGARDDYYFCKTALSAGLSIWCDMDLTREVKHRGEQDVGWFEEGEAAVRREGEAWLHGIPPGPSAPTRNGGIASSAMRT